MTYWIPAPPGLTAPYSSRPDLKGYSNDYNVLAINPEEAKALLSNGQEVSFYNREFFLNHHPSLSWVPAPAGWRAVFGYVDILSDDDSDDDIMITPVIAFGLSTVVTETSTEFDNDYAVVDYRMREQPIEIVSVMRSHTGNVTQNDYLVPPSEEPPLDEIRKEMQALRASLRAHQKRLEEHERARAAAGE